MDENNKLEEYYDQKKRQENSRDINTLLPNNIKNKSRDISIPRGNATRLRDYEDHIESQDGFI